MDDSDSYLVMEKMIQAGDVPLSELEHLLDALEEQGLITTDERESLFALAWKVPTDHPSPP